MPLTEFQKQLARLLSVNRTPEGYLAGGAALHFAPNTKRYSNDLDFFHDSEKRVSEAFDKDSTLLREHSMSLEIEINQPGYIRVTVTSGENFTKIEWAHDSAWRFMPVVRQKDVGYQLHPVDVAVNKVLALAGRDEARDFLDVLYIHEEILPLGPLVWAASGKDPGFTPLSLLELLKRRGRYRQEDFSRLHLAVPVELTKLKTRWLEALEDADRFVRSRPASEIGCLYYSSSRRAFIEPQGQEEVAGSEIQLHFGRPGGILPKCYQGDLLSDSVKSIRLK
jgi:hypothetical protein